RWCAHISTPPVRPLRTTQVAESNYKNSANAEPDDHALGRSRGGLTTKIHALTDTTTCPVAMTLTPGQAGDNPALLPLVEIRRTRIPPPAPHCGSAGSSTRSPNATIRSLVARPRAPPAVDHRPSTATSTSSATALNAASTGSNNGAASPPAMTSTR